jgi:hypothetical protein
MTRGCRTDEVVPVVLKGVRSACDILWRTMVKSATGVTYAHGYGRPEGISVQVNLLLIL